MRMKEANDTANREPAAAPSPADPDAAEQDAKGPDVLRFEEDLLTREEAVELTPDGKLPLSATHAIVTNPDGTKQFKRARTKYV
jgi:hypothetical protein